MKAKTCRFEEVGCRCWGKKDEGTGLNIKERLDLPLPKEAMTGRPNDGEATPETNSGSWDASVAPSAPACQ
jgi:hypothetical protein